MSLHWVSLKTFVLGIALAPFVVFAEPSEVQLFHRCYSQITGTRPKPSHSTLLKVANQTLTAAEGCAEVLNLGMLYTSGPNLGRTQGEVSPLTATDTQDAHNVLRTFTGFHKNWIGSGSFADALNLNFATDEIYSRHELSNYLSYLLFNSSLSYRDFVTGVRTVTEVRDGASPNGRFGQFYSPTELYSLSHLVHNFLPGAGFSNPANLQAIPSTFLPQGTLRGFRELDTSEMDARLKLGFVGGINYTDQYEHTGYTHLQNTKFRRPRGGGILGTPSYMMLNLGAGWTISGFPRSNGAGKLWRRMIRNSFSDLMCRSLPAVNAEDIVSYVRPASNLAYRSNATCMSCHATMDLGAGVFRNFNFASTKNTRGVPEDFPRVIEPAAVISHPSVVIDPVNLVHESLRDGGAISYTAAESDLLSINGPSGDNAFFRRPPNGRFIMRSYSGSLIDKPIYDVEGYGTEIAATDDFYICAAKRYVNFFTGFDASMQEVPNASPEEVKSRDYVIQLGLALKQHQNLRTMIESIIASDLYKEAYE